MSKNRYSMSFTTGSLLHRESIQLAEVYKDLGDWHQVRHKVVSENLLQTRTLNTLKRVCCEVVSRLRTLNAEEMRLLTQGSQQDQRYLLWIAVCRRYEFIADFAVEVLRERHITLKSDLNFEDFDTFFNQKSEWHGELEAIAPSTRRKLRQVLFKMLHEADLLTTNNTIHAALFSTSLVNLLQKQNFRDTRYFPVFDSDLKEANL